MKNTGDGRRVAKVERELQQVIAKFLISGFKSPLPGLVTISRVMMPADLRAAKVYVSVLGGDSDREKAVSLLNDRAFEVQKYIGTHLNMRYCPRLTFYADDITEKVMKIDKIFHEIQQEREQKTGSDQVVSNTKGSDLLSDEEE
jgi:ribosome-binding factor A